MAQRKVIWSQTADKQLTSVLEYWLHRNKSNTYAKRLLDLIAQKTTLIAEKPQIFKSTEFADIRIATLGHFSIFFIASEHVITIMSFWDNRQDSKRFLEILHSKGQ